MLSPYRSLAMVAALALLIISTSFLKASTVDGILYARDFPGNDIGAKVVAADHSCAVGCTILLPKGRLDFSTPIVIRRAATVVGQGTGATLLNWVGESNAIPIKITYVMRVRLRDFTLNRNDSITSAPAIEVFGAWDTQIDDIWCTANWGVWQRNAGFQGCIWITGTTQAPSCLTRVSNSRFENYSDYSIRIDNAVDTYITGISNASYPDNTSTDGLVIDSNVGGLHVTTFSCSYGRHCLVVRNTLGGINPHWIYFNQFEGDTTTGGDAIVFDSSLGQEQVAAVFTNSWSAAAGLNDSGAVVSPGANGLRIAGGSSIMWEGRVRRNAGNGILITSNTSSYINIHDSSIYANNVANSTDGHGIYVAGNSTHIGIINTEISNNLDYGFQRYGIKIARVHADQLRILNSDLSGNLTGPYFTANLGPAMVSGNMPVFTNSQGENSTRRSSREAVPRPVPEP